MRDKNLYSNFLKRRRNCPSVHWLNTYTPFIWNRFLESEEQKGNTCGTYFCLEKFEYTTETSLLYS